MHPIYLDYNATTPVDPRVLAQMLPYFTEKFGNPASRSHPYGWEAEEAVKLARAQIAQALHCHPEEIVFTSGATEANNLALKGVAQLNPGKHIITCVTEHKAVLDTAQALEQDGMAVTYLPVQANGLIDLAELITAFREDTVLVSVMMANNETGVLQPIEAIGQLCRAQGVLFHSDAAQAVGKIPIDLSVQPIDLMSISGHKCYAPKGIGALFVRRRNPRVRILPQMHGGGHERGMRSGTLSVPLIVGLGAAIELAIAELPGEALRLLQLRQRLEVLCTQIPYVNVNGATAPRLPGTVNLSFAFVEGEALLMGLNDTVALASGSACTSASLAPSHVLRAMGIADELAHSALRFGLGRTTTAAEIDRVIAKVNAVVARLREMSPQWEGTKPAITTTI